MDNPQSYNPESIQDGLKTAWLGKGSIRCYETVDSTNIEAKRLARSGAPEGTIVLAGSQSKGRGRMERTWISPQGSGIYMSVVLRPRILPEEVQKLTFVAAVALAFTFKRIGITPHIKWPNDILVNGKKVAGILMELTAGDGVADFVIIGIGINVNTSMNEFPLSIRSLATSINMVADRPVRRREIIKILLLQLELWYERFLTESFEIVLEAWRRLSNTLGARVMVVLSDKKLEGIAERVASDGSLMVRDDKGKLHKIIVGDVVHCRPL